MVELIPTDHNALLITLDSCRYDTFQKANTPNMNKIGKLQKAVTHGDYSLPSHASIYAGHIPRVESDLTPFWRLTAATKTDTPLGVLLDGSTIQEGYRNRGYTIRGFGGVVYFHDDDGILRQPYKEGEFVQFSKRVGVRGCKYPPKRESFPFCNVDEIADSVKDAENWFLFINAPETHWPYCVEKSDDPQIEELIAYSEEFRNGRYGRNQKFSYENGGNILHELQVKSLEFVDSMFGYLLDRLTGDKPIAIVICGDHGEAFGENGMWGHMLNLQEVMTVPIIKNMNYTKTS